MQRYLFHAYPFRVFIITLGLIVAVLAGTALFGYWRIQTEESRRQSIGQEEALSGSAPSEEPAVNASTNASAVRCNGEATPPQTEGPYYKEGSPERLSIREHALGTKLVLGGYVFDKNCDPAARVLLDFWQADANGAYDNVTYRFRGHQYTDKNGYYTLETVLPGEYPGRTPHIHVKVRSEGGILLTTQIYFPGVTSNQADSIFNPSLLASLEESGEGKIAQFNFILF